MNYYYIDLVDEPGTSWVLHEVVRKVPPHPHKEGLAPVFYKFFQFPDAKVRLKPQYLPLWCPKCERYESDKAFEIGFSQPVTIRLKGEFGHTTDRMFVIDDKVLRVLRSAKVRGYETKPLGQSGWHALRATLLVDSVESKWKKKAKRCARCGISDDLGLNFDYLSQLSLPSQTNTFFSTKSTWPASPSHARELFLTEDVVKALKAAKVKGPCCTRLWTEEERQQIDGKTKPGSVLGPSWRPPHSTVFLSGK
jgi:hypothetical protein